MKVKDFLYLHPENKELPLIIIDKSGINNYYRNYGEFLQFGTEKNFKYVNGCCQLDLDGESSFCIIYCDCMS